MVFLRWLMGGLIGAVLGAVVWVGIGYALNAEVSYVAIAIGFLCGLGVQMVGGEEDGFLPGYIAVACASISILVSKYMVISLLFANAMSTEVSSMAFTDTEMIASFAEEIVAEKQDEGKKLKLPTAYDDIEAAEETRFPRTIWRDAKKRWDKLPAEEQKSMKTEREEMMNSAMEMIGKEFQKQAFFESFTFYDVLWFGLAALTAFRVGSGLAGDDD